VSAKRDIKFLKHYSGFQSPDSFGALKGYIRSTAPTSTPEGIPPASENANLGGIFDDSSLQSV
jgi:hypothetical protein